MRRPFYFVHPYRVPPGRLRRVRVGDAFSAPGFCPLSPVGADEAVGEQHGDRIALCVCTERAMEDGGMAG